MQASCVVQWRKATAAMGNKHICHGRIHPLRHLATLTWVSGGISTELNMKSICTPISKLPDVGTTIFTLIGELAGQYDALNLSQGAPNFPCDPKLVAGALHHSMASHSELAERSVIVFSFGKSYHVTGWRVGYCLAPAALMNEIRKVHQFMTFAADTPMQYAFVEALADESSYLGLSAFYQRKRELLAGALAGSRFELLPSEGSFFMLARFRGFCDESDSDFVLRLIRDFAVATIPLSAFYSDGTDHGVIRLSFAKDDATLVEGARRLCLV